MGRLPNVRTDVEDRAWRLPFARSVRQPVSWGVASGLAVVLVTRSAALGASSPRALLGAVLAVVVPALVIGDCFGRRHPFVGASILLASSGTVLSATADGRWQGLVALAAIWLATRSSARWAKAALAVVVVAALAVWWNAGFDRGAAPGPPWREIAGDTGATLRRSLSSVGVAEVLVPSTGVLLWWIGLGVVVGAAVVAGRPSRALWIPGSVTIVVLATWAIRLLEGSVDPLGATWIVAGGVVLAAAGVTGSGTPIPRLAIACALLGASSTALAFVRELRTESTFAAAVAGIGALTAGAAIVAQLVPPGVSGSADAEPVG